MWSSHSSFFYIPSFLADRCPGRQQRRRRVRRRPRHHRRPVPARLPAADAAYRAPYGGNVDEKHAEAARHRPAHRPADDRGRDRAGRGIEAGHHGDRRGSARADCRPPRRSRRTGSSSARSATGRCCRCRIPPLRPDEFEEQVRRGVTVEKLQAALTDWITVSDKEVDAGVQAPQREGEARGRVVPRRQVPRRARRRPTPK